MREKLSIAGRYPQLYGPWISAAIKFYEELDANPEILKNLEHLGLVETEVKNGLKMIQDVLSSYAFYTNLKGESQKTTQLKEASFDKLNAWMMDFYAVAKIAFKNNPQQIESFGIVVRS